MPAEPPWPKLWIVGCAGDVQWSRRGRDGYGRTGTYLRAGYIVEAARDDRVACLWQEQPECGRPCCVCDP